MRRLSALALLLLFAVAPVEARMRRQPALRMTTHHSVEHYYEHGMTAIDQENWQLAIASFKRVAKAYPESEFVAESHYWRGYAHFQLGAWTPANEYFSKYLEASEAGPHFEEVFEYKLAMADLMGGGSREKLFGARFMPKWQTHKALALEIYDDIFTALPSSEHAARALWGKGHVLWRMREYEEAIFTFQGLVDRFPHHEFAPQAYLAVINVYADHCHYQPHDPDLLPLAQINLRKFRQEFPTDARLDAAEAKVGEMRCTLAQGLIDTARFFERTEKPDAACVYYANAARDYIGTPAADEALVRLGELGTDIPLPGLGLPETDALVIDLD